MAFPLLNSIILILVGYQRFPRHRIMLRIIARTTADVTVTTAMSSACAMVSIPLIFVMPRSLQSPPGPSGRAGVGSEVFSYVRSTYRTMTATVQIACNIKWELKSLFMLGVHGLFCWTVRIACNMLLDNQQQLLVYEWRQLYLFYLGGAQKIRGSGPLSHHPSLGCTLLQ